MKKIYHLFFTLFLGTALLPGVVLGQVTTNEGSGLAATYPSLADAITALNAATINSPVVITLTADETAPSTGYVITASGTSVNTIKINGDKFTVTAGTGYTAGSNLNAIFKLIGADYITIENFVMQENAGNTVTATGATNTMTEFGVALFYAGAAASADGAQNCTIQNNTISLSSSYNNTFGIYSNSVHSSTNAATTASAKGVNGGNHNLKIYGNTINNVRRGILIYGPLAEADFLTGIDIGGNSAATGNTITNFGGVLGDAAQFIYATSAGFGISLGNNIGANIAYNTLTSTDGSIANDKNLYGIFFQNGSSNALSGTYTTTVSNNVIDLRSGAPAYSIAGISTGLGGYTMSSASSLYINCNRFTNLTHVSSTATGQIDGIVTAGPTLHTTINGNIFDSINLVSKPSIFNFISASYNMPAGGTKTVNNNSILKGFTKSSSGISSYIRFYYDASTANGAGSTQENKNNNFSNISIVGINTIDGWYNQAAGNNTVHTISENIFTNWTINGTPGITYAISTGGTNQNIKIVENNLISNLNTSSGTFGIVVNGSGTSGTIAGNTIKAIKLTAGATTLMYGIQIASSATILVEKNSISDIEYLITSGTSAPVSGILISAGTDVTLQNNVIGDIRGPNHLNRGGSILPYLQGILITAGGSTTCKLYHNTVYLNANSTGTNFSSAAMRTSKTCNLTLRNNIFVNLSTPNGTGKSVAFQVDGTDLTAYNSASDRNLFYAGTPSSSNYIFSDTTNGDQTLADFQTRLGSPIDANSISLNPTFLSTTSGFDFLRIDPTVTSAINGGADVIAGLTTDIEGDDRSGSTPDIGADEFTPVATPCTPPTPAISLSGSSVLCKCNSETLTASGGTSYLWSTGETTTAISVSSPGTYSVVVTDANGCKDEATQTITLEAPDPTVQTVTAFNNYRWSENGQTYTQSGRYVHENGCVPTILDLTIKERASGLVLTSSMNDFSYCSGSASEIQTFSVSGTGLSDDIILTPPTGFEIRKTGETNFVTELTLVASSGTVTATSIDIRVGATGTSTLTTDTYTISATSSTTLETISVSVTVNSKLTPSVSILSSDADNIICSGTSVTFTATPTNGGLTPIYQWKLNDVDVGSNTSTYTATTLTDGDVVKLIMISSETCVTSATATSTTITTTVNEIVTPSVTIASSDANNDICSGTLVTFTATPTNGGLTPVYQWKLNNVNVGSNSATYSTTTLANNDVVKVVMISSETCVTSATVSSTTITTTVNPNLTPSVTIASSDADNVICVGTSVTFTATPTNGGLTTVYQWKVNDVNVGINSSLYTSTTLADGDVVKVVMISSETCVTSATATSTTITTTVNPNLTPSVAIASSDVDNIICDGTSVTFTATPTNGGLTPVYQWKVNDVDAGINSSLYTSTSLVNDDVVKVIMTSSETCVTSATATSTTITTTVNPNLTPSVTIASSDADNIICDGTLVTFTATPTNGGLTPVYQWKLNDVNVGTNAATYTITTLTNNDVVKVVMISSETCVTTATVSSTTITTTVNPNLTPSVTIASSDADNDICAGTSVTFTATPINGGLTPVYQWKVNDVDVGINSSLYTSTTLADGDIVKVVMTSSETCVTSATVSSTTITTTVHPNLVPSVSIASSDADNIICVGTSVTFTATPTNGGTTPSYQWKLNDVNVGSNSATYSTTTLANGDVVKVVMTSSETCVTSSTGTSGTIRTTVKSYVTPSVSTVSNDADNTICAGTSVTFTATPTNGGATPAYQWKLNDVNVGTNSSSYITTTLADGDKVKVVVTSSEACLSAPTANSSEITYTVNPILTPTVLLVSNDADNKIIKGTTVVFTATPTNGGSTPSYKWKLNNVVVGSNSPTYTNANLAQGDKVMVLLTSSETCVTVDTASSSITMTVYTPPTELKYNPSVVVLTKGTGIVPLLPTYLGDTAIRFTISGKLPDGMRFDTTTGEISGTPTELQVTPVVYTITVFNNGGSISTTFTLSVIDTPPINLVYAPANQRSTRSTPITPMLPTVGGGPVVSYSISPNLPAGLRIDSTTGIISGTLTAALTGTVEYTITARNSGGSATAKVTIVYNAAPTDIQISRASLYEGNALNVLIGSLTTTDPDAGDTHTYSLVSGDGSADNGSFTISGNQLLAGKVYSFATKNSYTIRIRSTDNGGLYFEKIFIITIKELPSVTGRSFDNITMSNKPVISKGFSTQLQVSGSDIVSVNWSPATGLSSTTILNPVARPLATTTYTVTITNKDGSVAVLYITVEVKEDFILRPNNILTPNADGFNDFWKIENIENYPEADIILYDRNGRVLQKFSNYNNRWDGKINGKPLATGTYYYIIQVKNKPTFSYKGFITIVNN